MNRDFNACEKRRLRGEGGFIGGLVGGAFGGVKKVYAMLAIFLMSLSAVALMARRFLNIPVSWLIGMGIGLVVLLLIAGVIWVSRRLARKRRADKLRAGLAGSTGGGLSSDPAELARMDDLRRNFLKGIDTFKEYGKDVYQLPWYVMVGEPGAGKTEAIRHCGLRFPETLQDRLQGTGGTYSMHWWFTNHAVILDTAGAMFTEASATDRFASFLGLLKTNRPECPINGMILAIPVDSLLLDDPVRMEDKARKISEQLQIVQKNLGVRFPIYVMVTKCDKLPGFREFSDAYGQERFENEMIGWSNPQDLAQDFDPSVLDQALGDVAFRLKRRCLSLLQDPIPRQSRRRADEVDALYCFPDSLMNLSAALKKYFEFAFVTGEWAKTPPFFRGIYFTSAMREGATLDQALARALGISAEKLPSGGVWQREKSFYLRDVFMEKMFHERGLVTTLKDPRKAYQRQLTWFYGITAASLLILLGGAWLVSRGLTQDLKSEKRFWKAANETWDNGDFLSVLGAKKNVGEEVFWEYLGDQPVALKRDAHDLAMFHRQLETKTREGLSWGWVFRPIQAFARMEQERNLARRVLLEGSVVRPAVVAAREKMIERLDLPTYKEEVWALWALIHLESKREEGRLGKRQTVVSPSEDDTSAEETKNPPAGSSLWLKPLFDYTLIPKSDVEKTAQGRDSKAERPSKEFFELVDRAYGLEGMKLDSREWISFGQDLASNQALDEGLKRFLGLQRSLTEDRDQVLEKDRLSLAGARKFGEIEAKLAELASSNGNFASTRATVLELEKMKLELDKLFGETGRSQATLPGDEYQKVFQAILDEVTPWATESHARPLFREIRDLLQGKNVQSQEPALARSPEDQKLHDEYLAVDAQSGKRWYQSRFEMYQRAFNRAWQKPAGSVVGRLGVILDELQQPGAAPAVVTYEGPRKDLAIGLSEFLRSHSNFTPLLSLLEFYVNDAKSTVLHGQLAYPLVMSRSYQYKSVLEFEEACKQIQKVEQDLNSDAFARLEVHPDVSPTPEFKQVQALKVLLTKVTQVRQGLSTGDTVGKVKIFLGAMQGATPQEVQVGGGDSSTGPVTVEVVPAGVADVEVFGEDGTSLGRVPPGDKIQLVAELDLDQGLMIKVRGYRSVGVGGQPSDLYASGKSYLSLWGAIKMAHQLGQGRAGKTRTIVLPTAVGKVHVRFEFPGGLPSTADWPKRTDFGLQD